MNPAVTGTDLVYNIVEQTLFGSIDGTTINTRAVAGGRAGSKLPGVVIPVLANNPYATRVKKSATRPGGPVVLGTWRRSCRFAAEPARPRSRRFARFSKRASASSSASI